MSRDERFLLGARSDGTIVVWRIADGRTVAILRGHRQRVASLAILDDGTVLSAGWDGLVLRWDLRALDLPVAQAVAETEARWALELRTALGADGE